jgi:hypothetical protein
LYIYFDEIQYLRDWEVHLKSLVDSYPNYKFVVTGSAAAALRLKSNESGAGRFSDYILPPLTFAEYLSFINKEAELVTYIEEFESIDDRYSTNNIEELNKEYEFNYKWIRLFYIYGEGQGEKSILSLLDKAIQNNEKEFNMSGGEQLRDYLNIKNVVKNILLISNQTLFSNQIINCCNGKPISIRKLVENHLNKKEYNIKLNLGFYSYPNHEPMAFWGDNTKLNLIKKGRK